MERDKKIESYLNEEFGGNWVVDHVELKWDDTKAARIKKESKLTGIFAVYLVAQFAVTYFILLSLNLI